METIDVYSSTCIDLNKENAKDPQFEVDDHVRISKCKKKFATDYVSNWSEKVFEITEVKNTVPWIDVTSDFNGEEIVGTFYKKELQKASQKECGIWKVIMRKGKNLYIKWKGCDSCIDWIDKKGIV